MIPTLMNEFVGHKPSVEEITVDVEIAKEHKLKVESNDVTELLQPHNKIVMDEKLSKESGS